MSLSSDDIDQWRRLVETRKATMAPVLMTAITLDPKKDDVHAAIVRMCATLAKADRLWSSPDNEREAAYLAITAVLDFIDRLDTDANWMMSFITLRAALVDLMAGRAAPPMLRPRKTRGRRPDSSGRMMTKASAAAAMSVLMNAGLTREKAARRVETVLRRDGVKLEGGALGQPWRTVAGWRDEISKMSEHWVAVCYFGGMTWMAKEQGSSPVESFRKGVLIKLSGMLSLIAARNSD
jgi:hypothetical protein